MVTFYRTPDCAGRAAIQDALEELCIAHKVVLVSGCTQDAAGAPGWSLSREDYYEVRKPFER